MDIPAHRANLGGQTQRFDVLGAFQFGLLTCKLGIREFHTLLDIGCGCLRGGRFFITYLRPGHYYGIEPDRELLEAGIEHEVGREVIERKRPVFSHDAGFALTAFGRKFDYLMAQSIFSHTAPLQTQRCLREAAAVMNPSACLVATYFPGESSYTGTEWVQQGVKYNTDDIYRWAADAGLKTEPLDWFHPSQRWLLFTLR